MSHPASLTTIQGFLETWLFWLYAPERLELQNPSQPTWNCLFMIMTKASAAVDTIIITCLKKLIQLSGTWISIWIALNPLFGSLVEPFTLEELDSTWSPKTYSYSAFILHAKPFYRGGGGLLTTKGIVMIPWLSIHSSYYYFLSMTSSGG